ncbi:MAG: terminase, partial [Deltaproteobacteria bacterium]
MRREQVLNLAIKIEPVPIPVSKPWVPEPARQTAGSSRVVRFTKPERRVFRRRRKVPVSRWAERHRVVTRGPLESTKWRNATTPYLADIMDASFFPSVQTIIVVAAPQVGKSAMVDTCVGYVIDRDPGPVLYVYPDRDTAEENAKDRIIPMINTSPRLRSYLTGSADDEAAKRINLQHMQIYMAWAHSAIKLGNKSIRYVIFDEVDKYPETAGKREADPISLGEARTTTYKYSSRKIWKVSTPTIEDGPIWKAFTQEAQVIFDYHVRCPECGKRQVMEFEQIKWPEDERDPRKIELLGLAWYECKHCQARWDDYMRDMAVAKGEWRTRPHETSGEAREGNRGLWPYLEAERPLKIAFHIPSWLSHFVGLAEVAAAFLRSLTDKTKLKDFRNKHQALPWLDYTQEREEDKILALRDDRPRGLVPSGGIISCLTAGVDTQDNGFWYEIRAWAYGLAAESWQIREGFVDSFEALARVLFEDSYYDADGNEYRVRFVVHDAMGHRTAEVYDFARLHRGRMLPFKGEQRMRQPWAISKLDVYPGTNKPIPGGLRLLRADVNYYKNHLAHKLEIAPADPGAWHLHSETTEEWARQMCAEYINDKGLWENPAGRANHAWDCSVYN